MAKKPSGSDDRDDKIDPVDQPDEPVVDDEVDASAPAGDENVGQPAQPVKKSSKSAKKPKAVVRSAGVGVDGPIDDKTISKPVQSKKKLIIILIAVGVVLIGAAVAGYVMLGTGTPASNANNNGSSNATADDQLPRHIDGVLDTPEHQNRFPVAVMIENQSQARPQSGLEQANVVYEALAEGGITRFLGIFTLTRVVEAIGPVRSARPYYVDWARGYKALYVHAGGSPKGLTRITSVGVSDLNQFFNSQYFYRDRSRNVASEHTLYTSSTLLSRALNDKKLPDTGDFDSWTFKSDAAASARPAGQHITIDFSSFSYKVDYEYDAVTNTYARSQGEQPHVMRDGAKIAPKNVVVIRVKRSLEDPKDSHGRLTLDVLSSGPAAFYVDGHEYKGTWKKASAQDGLQLLDESGDPFKLNAGQTWVEVVPPEQTVTVR